MKKILQTTAIAILAISAMTSCTSSIQLKVMRPAQIDVPKSVQTLGLVNRYKPQKPDRLLNILEGIITGEGIGQDKRGAETSLEGLGHVLQTSPRFQTKRLALNLEGSGLGTFPEPLPAEEVKRLCEISQINALVTIEAFDSDSKINYGTYSKKVTRDNQTVQIPMQTVDAGVRVTVGWRMYSAVDGSLIDQYRMVETIHFKAEGDTREAAMRRLPSRESMVQEIGRVTGNAYAFRISPAWFWVGRTYYTKGSPEMKQAKRRVRIQDWDGAAQIWQALLNHEKPKVVKRAAYNMALASEVLGDLPAAVSWTDRAYAMGVNRALDYNGILRQRIRDEARLKNQLSKPENEAAGDD